MNILTSQNINPTFAKPFFKNESYVSNNENTVKSKKVVSNVYDYGQALNQIEMLNGDSLHNLGYDGDGIVVAILDAGFTNVNTLDAFDSLWNSGRIIGIKIPDWKADCRSKFQSLLLMDFTQID